MHIPCTVIFHSVLTTLAVAKHAVNGLGLASLKIAGLIVRHHSEEFPQGGMNNIWIR